MCRISGGSFVGDVMAHWSDMLRLICERCDGSLVGYVVAHVWEM